MPVCQNVAVAIHCDTALPLIFWKMAMIFVRCKNSWAIRTSVRLCSTRTCCNVVARECVVLSIHAKAHTSVDVRGNVISNYQGALLTPCLRTAYRNSPASVAGRCLPLNTASLRAFESVPPQRPPQRLSAAPPQQPRWRCTRSVRTGTAAWHPRQGRRRQRVGVWSCGLIRASKRAVVVDDILYLL